MEKIVSTGYDQKVLGSLYFGLPGNENLKITFQYNLPSRQCTKPIFVRAFLFLQNRRHFPGPLSTRLLPLWRLHCFHTVYHEDGISFLRTKRNQKEPYQENMKDEERFQINIQSQHAWQLVTCGQGRCPARAEHRESVFFISSLQFPGVTS